VRFGRGVAFVFEESLAFVEKAWLLALLLSVPSFILGLSDLVTPGAAVQERLIAFQAASSAANVLTIYWVIRFQALKHNLAEAIRINRASAKTFAPFALFMWLFGFSAGVLLMQGAQAVLALALIPGLILLAALALWIVTAPSGATVIGPLRSARIMTPHLLWSGAFLLVIQAIIAIADHLLANAINALNDAAGSMLPLMIALMTIKNAVMGLAYNTAFGTAIFVIAHRAGMRVDSQPGLAAIFE